YRPYTARPPEVGRDRKIEAVAGTEVALRVRTNQPVKEASIHFGAGAHTRALRADALANEPQGFQARFLLEESGSYRIHYLSTDGEDYDDPTSFPVIVQPDRAPIVELTRPGQDVTLPANGLLQLEGNALDDFGIKSLQLQMQTSDGRKLQIQPYRADKGLKLPGGGLPLSVAYKDFVDLAKIKGRDGKPVEVQTGQVLEYWLEAADACDYPRANVTSSKHFRVTIAEPQKDSAQQRQDRQKAEQEKKEHDAQQDQQLNMEGQARQQEQQRQRDETARQDEAAEGGKQEQRKDNGNNGQNGGQDKKQDSPPEGRPNQE